MSENEMIRQADAARRPDIFGIAEMLPYMLTKGGALDLLKVTSEAFEALSIPHIGEGQGRRFRADLILDHKWRRTIQEGWTAEDLLGPGVSLKEVLRAGEAGCTTYFIGAGEAVPPAIKIGRAVSPLTRIDELQTGTHHTLKIWAIRGGNCEQFYHTKYRKQRIRGEWFRLSWDLAQEIRRMPFANGGVQ